MTTIPYHEFVSEKLGTSECAGRALAPGECVHHVDQNRSNNDPINLRLMSRSDHAALHRALEKGVTNGLT